jgi:uncharacterized protein (UPF0332 family)
MKEPLAKAEEALKAAELCCENGLYDSSASRCYYATFWAAIATLEWAGYPPQRWSHTGLSTIFGKELVKKRHLFSPSLAGRLSMAYDLRRLADYGRQGISGKRAKRALDWAGKFVTKAKEMIGQ